MCAAVDSTFQERVSDALSMPDSPQRFLYMYWLAGNERLKMLANETRNTLDGVWMRNTKKRVDEATELIRQLRQVERYLGHKPKEIDPRILEDAMYLTTARWVRASVHNGDSDELIACFLRHSLGAGQKRGRGGAVAPDSHALLALTLRESYPAFWSYPKLADQLLGCRVHKEHAHDTSCTLTLKKAVERLRRFLRELGYEQRTVT